MGSRGHLLAYCGLLFAVDADGLARAGLLGLEPVCLCLALRHCWHHRQLYPAEGAFSSRDLLFHRHGPEHTGGLQTADGLRVSEAAIIWLIAEGVCYITGAVFYSLNKKKYMHSVFHFFVLAGSVCHIVAVWDVLMEQL